MNARNALPTLIAAVAISLAGCGAPRNAEAPGSAAAPAAARTFEVKGVIKELHPEKLFAKVTHEEIPDYMPAMTMNLTVRDARELAGLAPADAITFRLNVTADEHWIDRVKKIAGVEAAKAEGGDPFPDAREWRRVRFVEPLNIGDAMENYRFTNELGQAVTLAELKGQAYAFTFIFTRCPLPDFCPRMSSQFQDAQRLLANRAAGPTNWRLFSITMDPEFDTPEVLQRYASRFKSDPIRWQQLTAPLIDITAIGEQFGLEFYRPDGTISHNLRTVVIDAAGKVQNIIIGNSWKAAELVEYLVRAAAAKPAELAGEGVK